MSITTSFPKTTTSDLPEEQRLCWLCKNFEFDGGSPGYSSITPGAGAEIGCGKDHWAASSDHCTGLTAIVGTVRDFRDAVRMARTCRDFALADGVAEEIAAAGRGES